MYWKHVCMVCMWMYVYVCVRMYVCVHVCVYVCNVCKYVCMNGCMDRWMDGCNVMLWNAMQCSVIHDMYVCDCM